MDEKARKKVYKGVMADKRAASDELERGKTEQKPRLVKEDSRGEVWRWEYENQWGEEWVKVSYFRLLVDTGTDETYLPAAFRFIPATIASQH